MGSKTFLIIGGSGFIGKSILKYFLVSSHLKKKFSKIIILSRNRLNNNRLKNELKKNYKIIEKKSDIIKLKKIPFADYVVYSILIKNFKKDYLALKNYINIAKLYHRKSTILYISSGAVDILKNYKLDSFNKAHKNFFNLHKTFNFKKNYKEFYGYLKYLNEKKFQELGHLGMNISIARCYTFVGEFLPLNSHFIIGNFIQNILRRESIKILSNYPIYRSYMHTDDLVKWLLKILYNSNTKCPIYNVGSDDKISLHELATFLAKKYQLNVTASKILSKKTDCYVPNISKTNKLLNLNIKYKSIQAVIKTINAHSKINKNIF